jgi:hypothetical protein
MQFISSVIGGAFGLVFLIAWVLLVGYALLDLLNKSSFNQTNKLLWLIIILIAPILGSLLYIFWGRNKSLL